MIRASSLSGDTLIECHFPVQLPAWQLPIQTGRCSSSKKPGRLCSVVLTRAVSLPERDSLQREPAFSSGRKHISSSDGSLKEDRAEEEGASDSSGRDDFTSSPEEALTHISPHRKKDSLRSRNPFLPCTELDEDEEDDSEGDNLHRYHEDSSFVLHGNSNWVLSNASNHSKTPHAAMDGVWVKEVGMLDPDSGWLSNQTNQLDTLPSCQCFLVRRSHGILMDCGEQELNEEMKDHMSCFNNSQHKCCSEMLNGHTESVSDSSSNSSDGVLVNFCTIYNKSNNPSIPHDLSSPAMQPSQSADGSVFLNLRPVSQTPNTDVQRGDRTVSAPLETAVDMGPSAPCQSPQGLDTNCNLYPPGPLSQVLSSLEASDLTACLQSQATLALGTNQKYYKLVTCDPPSQSPSPAWSSVPSCPDGQRRGSPVLLPSDSLFSSQRKEAPQKDKVKEKDEQQKESPKTSSAQSNTVFDCTQCDANKTQFTTPVEKALCKKADAGRIQCYSHTAASVCQSNAEIIVCQGPSFVSTQPSVTLDQDHCENEAEEHGTCSSATPVVRYSKAQRPTSLPIQPCVLLTPPGKPQAQQLGSLLDQYISQRGSKPSSSQLGSKCKGKGSGISTYLQPSPLGNHGPILLEGPSSSDTCSTCVSSPECSSHWNTWSHASTDQGQSSPCGSQMSLTYSSPKPKVGQKLVSQDNTSPHSGTASTASAPNQPRLMTVATCQDLINLIPEETHASTEPKHHTPIQIRSSSYHAALSQSPSPASHSPVPTLLVSLSPPITPQPQNKSPQCPSVALTTQSHLFHNQLTASLSPASPLSCLRSQQRQDFSGPGTDQRQCQQRESLILSDRPPVEFCLSPDASYDSLSISHLQRRGLLRSVSMAVDLIMAHFSSSRDPEDKMRLGNSSWSPTIAGLVLEHLCPTVQNILEDGLRDHKLDVIVGQRRNHTWSVVEVSTQTGSCAQVLNSLVSKINQCSQLTDYSMRLRAFIMGLLNLRALGYWLCHLQSQKDVVTTHYHSWGFLPMSQGQSQPLFQELLLLLQPLSMLPFDLNLLLEPRLLYNRQLCSEEYGVPPPCSTLLMTSWPLLQADKKAGANESTVRTGSPHQVQHLQGSSQKPWCHQQQVEENRATVPNINLWSASSPGWWQRQPAFTDGVVEGEDCCQNSTDTRPSFQRGKDERQEQRISERETVTPSGAEVQDESPSQDRLRWAKLFGAAMDPSTRTHRVSGSISGTQEPRRRPSEWLQLNRSQLGLLAQSVWSVMELTWTEIRTTPA